MQPVILFTPVKRELEAAHAVCLLSALPLVFLEKQRESGLRHGEGDLSLVSDAGIQSGSQYDRGLACSLYLSEDLPKCLEPSS